jgi:ABC-type nitrate/sulfonate/bicarbonate transport system substrate-binding protein
MSCKRLGAIGRKGLSAITLLSIALFYWQSLPAQEQSLHGVYNAISGAMTPMWVAQEAGLFGKHGLTVDLKYLAATSAVQGMLGGSDDVGLVGSQGIDAKLEGADLVYIASAIQTFVFHLYAQPQINSVADLKGKVVAVTQPAASTDYAARIALSRFGLTPDKDVKILYAGNISALLTAVQSGNAAAGIMSAPTTLQAKASGLKPILNITDLKIPILFVGVLTSPKVIREKNESLIRFVRAHIEAISVIRKDKETTIKSLKRYLKTDDPNVLEAVYEEYKDVFPQAPLMTAAEVKGVLDVAKSPRAKQTRPEDFFDNSLVQKIQNSGFIDSLYGKR